MEKIFSAISWIITTSNALFTLYANYSKKLEEEINLIDGVAYDKKDEDESKRKYKKFFRIKMLKKLLFSITNKNDLIDNPFEIDISRAKSQNSFCIIVALFTVPFGSLLIFTHLDFKVLSNILPFLIGAILVFINIVYLKSFWINRDDFSNLQKYYGENKVVFIRKGKKNRFFKNID